MNAESRNRVTIRNLVEGLSTHHDPEVWRRLAAPAFVHHLPMPGLAPGIEGAVAMAGALLTAMPDLHVEVKLLLAEADLVVERASATGTHRGPFLGAPPTGQPLSWTETHVYRLDQDGRLLEFWPTLRFHRLMARLTGAAEPAHRPAGTWWSPIPARAMTMASRLMGPASFDGREAVRMYVERFKNGKDFGVFPRLFTPGFRHHFGYDGDRGTMTSWVRTGQDFLAAFPDVHVELIHLVKDGAFVVEHNQATGSFRQPFRGRPATGGIIRWREVHIYRLERGKIAENWPEVDTDALGADFIRAAPHVAPPSPVSSPA